MFRSATVFLFKVSFLPKVFVFMISSYPIWYNPGKILSSKKYANFLAAEVTGDTEENCRL
jgi:hypothetical protein